MPSTNKRPAFLGEPRWRLVHDGSAIMALIHTNQGTESIHQIEEFDSPQALQERVAELELATNGHELPQPPDPETEPQTS